MSAIEDEDRDPLEVLAAEFIDRQRSGQYPSISEYVALHPELAEQIEEFFPTIAAMEQLKAHREGSPSGRVSLGAPQLERLGDFRILGEIGRGGMGIVYEAYQESLGRHVAVKVLPRQSLLDAKQLQRFQREAQIAARLHHTNIVPLFGVGEQEGFHYFVMQLIRGVGLDAVIGELRQLAFPRETVQAGDDSTSPFLETGCTSEAIRLAGVLVRGRFGQAGEVGLSSASRAALGLSPDEPAVAPGAVQRGADSSSAGEARGTSCRFGPPYWRSIAAIGIQVADALHYAHAQHTLHRDIKPANLLLDSQGIVWITDFGLAKVIDQEHPSQTAALAGTLRYMAPEQFSGRFDARSDIYSLGLTLYELLTLRPAYSEVSRSELIRSITQQQPPRPRKLNPEIPRDLETIVLKAIAREPADRYPTALELAHDLQRFLEDRPIAARRASATERLWRWARRNRMVASLSATTLVLLILVAVVASVGYVRTARLHQRSEDISTAAVDALDKIFQELAPERAASSPSLVVVDSAGEEITVPEQRTLSKETATLLEHMLKFYDRLAEQGTDDARLLRRVAEANRRVGNIRQRLGNYDEAKVAYARAIERYTPLADASAEGEAAATEIARIYNELGNVYSAANEPSAEQAYRSALATLQATPAETSPKYRYELARTHYLLGRQFGGQPMPIVLAPGGRGRHSSPPGSFFSQFGPSRGPERPNQGKGASPPGPPAGRPPGPKGPPPGPQGIASGTRPQPPMNFFAEKREHLEKAVELLERLVAEYPDVPDYRHLLACCYREVPPWARGPKLPADAFDKAVGLLTTLVDEYPDVPDYRYDLSQTYARDPLFWRSFDASAQKRLQTLLKKALEISDELVRANPNIPDYAASQVHLRLRLAGLLWDNDPAIAEESLRKAADLQSSLVRRFPQNGFYKFGMGMIHESRGGFFADRGRNTDACAALKEAIASFKGLLGDGKFPFASNALHGNCETLAELQDRLGDKQAAAETRRQAQEWLPKPPFGLPPAR